MSIKTQIKHVITTITVFLSVTIVAVQAQEDPLAGLDDYVKKGMEQWQVPGVAVAIVKDDKVVLSKGYGTRTLGKNQPVDENTLFAIASQTKTFTATALAMLAGEGKIDWDDRMFERLPGFQVGDELATSHTTIRDALSHRTGVMNHGGYTWHSNPSRSRKDLLELMKYLPNVHDFRSGFHYNNDMFIAAGEIIPEVTGMSWDDFISTRIFKPLGMKNSNTSVTKFGRNNNVATPHILLDDKVVTVPYHNVDNTGPAGSINSSAADMAQWIRFQLNNGKVNGQTIVSEDALNETRQIHNTVTDGHEELWASSGLGNQFHAYGLGVFIGEVSGYKIYHHSGAIDGMKFSMVFVPELALGIAVLSNISEWYPLALSGWMLARYTGDNETDWNEVLFNFVNSYTSSENEKIQSRKENAVSNTQPSLSLDQYAGTYVNELVGKFIITLNGSDFSYRQGEVVQGKINHLHFDTFLIEPTAPLQVIQFGEKFMQFNLDLDGSVKSVTVSGYAADLTLEKIE